MKKKFISPLVILSFHYNRLQSCFKKSMPSINKKGPLKVNE